MRLAASTPRRAGTAAALAGAQVPLVVQHITAQAQVAGEDIVQRRAQGGGGRA
jgi:hypothetical protein